LVVVATQEKLGYGLSFTEAMTSLLGKSMTLGPSVSEEKQKAEQKPNETAAPQQSPSPATIQNLGQLVERAIQEFDDYQRLTSQGKLGEAGQKLEQHKRTLEEIKKLSGKP
jgi:TfoX/Sxy family transcriptional regulator of competence genes